MSSFYTSLASSTVESKSSFSEMREEAATPGGLNEQSLRGLSGSEHFELAEKVSLSSTNHYITHIPIDSCKNKQSVAFLMVSIKLRYSVYLNASFLYPILFYLKILVSGRNSTEAQRDQKIGRMTPLFNWK